MKLFTTLLITLTVLSISPLCRANESSNLALRGTASQSSINQNYKWANASLAIDGDTDGDFFNGESISLTGNGDDDTNPWWKVKLAETAEISKILVWNRNDFNNQHSDQLSNSTVVIYEGEIEKASFWIGDAKPERLFNFTVDKVIGDSVKITKNGKERLSVAEVQIFGTENVYSLPVYNISTPSCTVDNRGQAAKVNITCNYDVAIPQKLINSGLNSSIYGSNNCTATDTGLGDAEDVKVVSTNLEGNNDDYEVVIQVTPDDTDTTAEIKFCLHTELKDDQSNVMIYQSQVFDILFNYTVDFNTTILSSKFDGFNETAADLGTVDFQVEAYRCNSNKEKDDSGDRLTINDPLYVCIKSNATGIVINEVTEFSLRKDGVEAYKAVEENDGDFNTFVQNLETDRVLVATRPQAKLFNDNNEIIIEGSVVLGSAAGSRYLARFTQELTGGEVTTSNFEMEVGVVKSVSAADTVTTGNFISFCGTIISIVVMFLF